MLTRRTLFLLMGGTALAAGGVAASRVGVQPEPPAPPSADAGGHLLWRNWSGIQHSYPASRAAPADEGELADLVRKSPGPIRAVGAGHSFMPLVPTSGTLVTLDRIAGLDGHDAEALTAHVRAGTRLADLGPALSAVGQEMPNLPDINKQSLAGALSTATHGTGVNLMALHGNVQAFRLVTADGQVLDCSPSQNADLFAAARVGLGAFGILTRVTLKNSPAHRVERRVWLQPVEQTLAEWPTLQAAHRNVEFYYLPFTGMTAVITHDETDAPATPRPPTQDNDAVMSLKALRDWLGWSPAIRRRVAKHVLSGLEPERVVAESWQLLSNERPIRFNEMEFHLPREAQVQALKDVIEAIETRRHDVFFPIEARVIAPDDAWLSPFHDRPSGSIAVHAYYKDDYQFLFDVVEPILRRHGGRPHWGKLNTLKTADFIALYPRFRDAMDMRRQVDPEGRFLNDYLRGVFTDA
ncbi:D-arabinono-1,4-lactone oxidase [Nitrospirillum viridazoti]|uniref:FAD-linked oxidoreductase n=1 Tax=Nitrospirillum amazonense TaxID=28077 RepID=A0A560IE69_9PROT|nr:D-arabinono-1,4-lactone oxidase [Nitrospirillum amazonense]TWB56411.1 FAD-linked oxidoreductase [Nitrospirillum amazonense]